MYIEDHQWPWPHHPAAPDTAGDGLDVDTTVTVQVFQLRPLTWQRAIDWCGGTPITVNGGPAVLLGSSVAGLGDYVVADGAGFRAEQADGFNARYVPVTTETA